MRIGASPPIAMASSFKVTQSLQGEAARLRWGCRPTWGCGRARGGAHRHLICSKGSARMKVAFIGLGVMGFPMAGHLAKAGHDVSVFNRSPDKAARWAAQYGGKAGATIAEAVAASELVA